MTEIVERLERQAVNVENDGHVSAARAMREAATALTEARAEIERLRQDKSAGFAFWQATAKRFADARRVALRRALAAEARAEEAESALAEARKVIEPIVSRLEWDGHMQRWALAPDMPAGSITAARRFIASQEPAEQEK